MATVREHYDQVLSDVYSWMHGGFEAAIERNIEFINKHQLVPRGSGVAVDLGAGCGFQSIPLAQAGYSVVAIDMDAKLLSELTSHCGELPITSIQDDLINFDEVVSSGVELIVCMTDTLLHLESKEQVIALFDKVFDALDPNGRFVITFRDLTDELSDVDRFLPVKSDDTTIFTCFLEYESDAVKVHDLVYKKPDGEWRLFKSFYRKLRLSEGWVSGQLSKCGFKRVDSNVDRGLITLIAYR